MIGRVGTTAGVLALVALTVSGCGAGDDAARTRTTTPAAFVDAVSALVQPAQRMGVVATTVLEGGADQPQQVEVAGLTSDVARQISRFGALRLGDPALAATQKRLLAAMGPIAATMRQVRAGIEAGGHAGLQDATTRLLDELKALPSAG